jgi:hypothetical protein
MKLKTKKVPKNYLYLGVDPNNGSSVYWGPKSERAIYRNSQDDTLRMTNSKVSLLKAFSQTMPRTPVVSQWIHTLKEEDIRDIAEVID